jgi:hypothetical protein
VVVFVLGILTGVLGLLGVIFFFGVDMPQKCPRCGWRTEDTNPKGGW